MARSTLKRNAVRRTRSIRLRPDADAWIEKEAAGHGMSWSEYVRHVLEVHARAVEAHLDGTGERPRTMPSWHA